MKLGICVRIKETISIASILLNFVIRYSSLSLTVIPVYYPPPPKKKKLILLRISYYKKWTIKILFKSCVGLCYLYSPFFHSLQFTNLHATTFHSVFVRRQIHRKAWHHSSWRQSSWPALCDATGASWLSYTTSDWLKNYKSHGRGQPKVVGWGGWCGGVGG